MFGNFYLLIYLKSNYSSKFSSKINSKYVEAFGLLSITPVSLFTFTKEIPSGIFLSLNSRFYKASCIKSIQIGKAIVDPYSFSPNEVKLSVPTQTVVDRSS